MLKRLILALVVALSLVPTALARDQKREVLPPIWPNLQAVVELRNSKEGGSGCVTPLGIFTAAHVGRLPDLVWSSPGGEWHSTRVAFLSEEEDLARLSGEGTLPPPASIATHPPRSGELVAILGSMNDMRPRPLFLARVLGLSNGELYLDGMGFPGTSGSCVFSEKGEVYGIMLGAHYWSDDLRPVARAAPLWSGQ